MAKRKTDSQAPTRTTPRTEPASPRFSTKDLAVWGVVCTLLGIGGVLFFDGRWGNRMFGADARDRGAQFLLIFAMGALALLGLVMLVAVARRRLLQRRRRRARELADPETFE